MIEHTSNGLRYFTFNSFPDGDLVHAVFARAGGVSPHPYESLNLSISTGDTMENARANRRRAFEAVGLPFATMADVWQIHSADTVRFDAPRPDREVKAD